MNPIIITPLVGIGPLKLGMTEQEVQETFNAYTYNRSTDHAHTLEFEDLFKIEYDGNNKVHFIELINPCNDTACLYKEWDVFRIKANELVMEIDKKANFVRDRDSELGYSYTFSELQLFFWRSHVITEHDLQSNWFVELSPENQEEEKRSLYFNTVAIAAPGYR
jgi:hypothetical protein